MKISDEILKEAVETALVGNIRVDGETNLSEAIKRAIHAAGPELIRRERRRIIDGIAPVFEALGIELTGPLHVQLTSLISDAKTITTGDPDGVRMNFGKFDGRLISSLPGDYLLWMVREKSQFSEFAETELERRSVK